MTPQKRKAAFFRQAQAEIQQLDGEIRKIKAALQRRAEETTFDGLVNSLRSVHNSLEGAVNDMKYVVKANRGFAPLASKMKADLNGLIRLRQQVEDIEDGPTAKAQAQKITVPFFQGWEAKIKKYQLLLNGGLDINYILVSLDGVLKMLKFVR